MTIYGYIQGRRLLVNMKRFTTLVSVWTQLIWLSPVRSEARTRTVPLPIIVLLLDLYARIIES
jgi:hypothetical protein